MTPTGQTRNYWPIKTKHPGSQINVKLNWTTAMIVLSVRHSSHTHCYRLSSFDWSPSYVHCLPRYAVLLAALWHGNLPIFRGGLVIFDEYKIINSLLHCSSSRSLIDGPIIFSRNASKRNRSLSSTAMAKLPSCEFFDKYFLTQFL